MCVELPEVLALLGEEPEVATVAVSPPSKNTCGAEKHDEAASEKGFRVFSFRNTQSGHIGDSQIICAQYVRLTW